MLSFLISEDEGEEFQRRLGLESFSIIEGDTPLPKPKSQDDLMDFEFSLDGFELVLNHSKESAGSLKVDNTSLRF